MFPDPDYKDVVIVKVDGIKRKVDWVALELNNTSNVGGFIFSYDMDMMLYKYWDIHSENWIYLSEQESGKLYNYFLKKWQKWVDSR
jgi:hypothetical protein